MCQPYGLCFLFNSLKLLLFKLICLIEKHEFLKCNLDYKTAECLEINRKYALVISYHPVSHNSRHFVEVSIKKTLPPGRYVSISGNNVFLLIIFSCHDPKDWQWRIPSSVITFVPRYIFLSSPTGQTLAQTPQGQWCSSRIFTWYFVQATLSIW